MGATLGPSFDPTFLGRGASSIPTGQSVMDAVRNILGDTELGDNVGQRFKNIKLQGASNSGPLPQAYQWLVEAMDTASDKRIRRTSFGVINPEVGYVNPYTIGLFTLGEPLDMWERTALAVYGVTAVTNQAAGVGVDPYIQITCNHGGAIATGQTIEAYLFAGITDDINDSWTVVVPNSTDIRLMGCTATGAWTNGTGLIITSAEQWPTGPMTRSWDISDLSPSNTPQATMGRWMWQNGAIRLPPPSAKREIRITYNISQTPPSDASVSLGIPGCLNVLAWRTAALAYAAAGGQSPMDLFTMADGLQQSFLQPVVKDLQRERFIPPRYRDKRNTGPQNYY